MSKGTSRFAHIGTYGRPKRGVEHGPGRVSRPVVGGLVWSNGSCLVERNWEDSQVTLERWIMPDDQVTIDPEFRPVPPADPLSRRLRAAGVAGVVVAAFALGWFLRSPAPTESPDGAESAASSVPSTEPEATTAAVSTTMRPSTTTTTSQPADTIGLDVSLGEAVPGFTDTMIMAHWTETGIELVQWRPASAAPATIASIAHGGSGFGGLDAAATWYTVDDENGTLTVHQLAGTEPDVETFPNLEAVGVRVADSAWHDTEPGQLAWLTCSRAPDGPGTLYRLDVTDVSAEPIAVRPIDRPCAGEDGGVWLEGWGDWGFALGRWDGAYLTQVLLDADGTDIAALEDKATEYRYRLIASGPDGTIWTDHPLGAGPSSFQLSLDGRSRTPLPGLTDGEWTEAALWSPDGTRLALSPVTSEIDDRTIRIVETSTGTTIAELGEPEWDLSPTAWSSDSRFLIFDRRLCDDCGWWQDQQELAFYDTQTDTTTAINLPTATPDYWQSWETVSLTAPEPFDFNTQSLCHWFSPEQIDAIVTSTYEQYGIPLDPERTMDQRQDQNSDCFWSEPLVTLSQWEDTSPWNGTTFAPHPALDNSVLVSIGEPAGSYGLMHGISALLKVEGHAEPLRFGHSTGTLRDVETINTLGLTIANKILQQMGWIESP